MNSGETWPRCLDHLAYTLDDQDFNTWIRPLHAIEAQSAAGVTLRLLAPNEIMRDHVRERFLPRIEQALRQSCPERGAAIELVVGERPEVRSVHTQTSTPQTRGEDALRQRQASNLQTSWTFQNFVRGKSNQLAHAASLQVSENPSGSYNPLYIYGDTGLGKTHLMHAIGNQLLKSRPHAKVLYIRSEDFVRRFVASLRNNTLDRFKKEFRNLDALLIDDVQFFAGKDQSQEEFFHTFNALWERSSQIVLTSDRYPRDIDRLEDRLRSRFGSGLTVAVEPPEFETRVAILLNKAQEIHGVRLPEEVAFLIARRVQSNVRELEGALKNIVAQTQLLGRPLDLESTQSVLRDLFAAQERMVSVENIQKLVCEHYKVHASDLLSKSRSRSIARPRQIAMSLARELTTKSLPEIGRAFGGRDHTTVLHACGKIESLRATDSRLNEDYLKLIRLLSN
ncbi:MAG: chromosomal replication initiator protein DnaA [Gammaproteobacteria bacterium]